MDALNKCKFRQNFRRNSLIQFGLSFGDLTCPDHPQSSSVAVFRYEDYYASTDIDVSFNTLTIVSEMAVHTLSLSIEMQVHRINHITIVVRDMDRTARLFIDALGAEEVYRSPCKEYSRYPELFLRMSGLWLVVMQDPDAHRPRSYDHVALSVDSDYLDTARDRLRRAGAELVESRPRLELEGASVYFYDFDNHLFELHAGDLGERVRHYVNRKGSLQPV